MKPRYIDILSRIPGEPLWWDARGVPRYDPFSPHATPYAEEVVLMEIACQGCGTLYRVEQAWSRYDVDAARPSLNPVMHLHYGDPPDTGCCSVGPTMSSIPLRTIEFWVRDSNHRMWARREDLENIVLDTLE